MFSKSKRFTDQVDKAPAVGQYDISKAPSHGGAVLFPKDKRFKESGTVNDGHLLDISNCSTASTKSMGSLNNGVFVTPRKPCGKAKSKGTKANQTSPNDEFSYLSGNIVQLQLEIDKLRAENERLHKLKDGELTGDERQTMESSFSALKDELEKLRKQIEEEMERNKELVYQQNSYEFSLKTIHADLELAKTQIAALQHQINSLEQMNADITESREELENQCSKLHGMNITLQKEKLTFQDRVEIIESSWKDACMTNEELSADLLSCRERHKLEIESLEHSLKEKQSTVVQELTKDRRSLEETVKLYKNKVDELKMEMDQSLKNKMENINKLKSEKETLVNALETLKEEHEQVQQETLQLQEVISRKEEQNLENLRKCQNLEDQIVVLQRSQLNLEANAESLTKELKVTKTTLEKSEVECQTIGEAFEKMRKNYGSVCQARDELKHDLHVVKQDKGNMDNEIIEAQSLIILLRENEQDQRTIAENLATKLEVCNVTIENLNNMNTEYQNTIEGNERKVKDIVERLRNMTEKCETLEKNFALSQQSRDAEVERLGKELELSKTSLMNRKIEYETVNEDLREMRENYDDVCRHRLKLEHDLQVITHDKNIVDKQLSQKQNNLDALQQCEKALQQSEKEQRSTVDILKKKIDALKKENETAKNELTQQSRIEIGNLKEQLLNIQEENRSLVAAEEKTNKLKQEFGRRLLEAQKNLSKKEMELQSYKRDLDKFVEESEGQDSWKRKFEELEAKVSPFQEQLDAFELEKQALLNRNNESQSEIDKLGHQYARLLGHQNQKQKIRHVRKLIDENASLKTELAKVREELSKEKFTRRKLKETVAKATGTRRFDPSLAFKHNAVENKENTPLKNRP